MPFPSHVAVFRTLCPQMREAFNYTIKNLTFLLANLNERSL